MNLVSIYQLYSNIRDLQAEFNFIIRKDSPKKFFIYSGFFFSGKIFYDMMVNVDFVKNIMHSSMQYKNKKEDMERIVFKTKFEVDPMGYIYFRRKSIAEKALKNMLIYVYKNHRQYSKKVILQNIIKQNGHLF